ncbi:MAG: ATP synthase F0 subunit B [Verrucomicrobiaceae bacterium]|nr:MAG: ATP synthase F0 subunit B [Verrucomicrobiaceae bacterium]
MEILNQLGIDWPKIIAQIIIFGIVYLVLSKYAFGPVTAMLEQRRSRIAEGEANLGTIRENLAATQAQSAAVLDKANAEASRIVKEAQAAAVAIAEQKRQETVAEAQLIITKAKEATELERTRVLSELKRDFGRLVIETTSKVTGKTLTGEDHARLNKEALSQIG